jgi:hypothetical protein
LQKKNKKILFMELKFGKKIWTAENLSVTNFVNGDSITIAKNAEEWKKLCDEKKPAGAYIDFKDSFLQIIIIGHIASGAGDGWVMM